jgi:hypothetical protein
VPGLRTCEWGVSRHRNTPVITACGRPGHVVIIAGVYPGRCDWPGLPAAGEVSLAGLAAVNERRDLGRWRGVSQDIRMGWPAGSVDVEGALSYHRCHHRGPVPGRGGPGVRGVSGLGVEAGGPVPGRGRGRVRAAVPAAEDLTERDQRPGRRSDRAAAQGPGRAGPGRRAGDHLLAPGTPPPAHGVTGDHQPVPDPARAGHARAAQTPALVLPAVRRRTAQRMLAIRLHPLPSRRRRRHRDLDLAR